MNDPSSDMPPPPPADNTPPPPPAETQAVPTPQPNTANQAPPQPGQQPAPQAGGQPSTGGDMSDDQWVMIAHLSCLVGFIGPLIIWLIKKDQNARVGNQAKEALNLTINVIGAVIGLTIVSGIFQWIVHKIPFIGGLVGILIWLVIMAIWIAALVLIVRAAIDANKGQDTRYPFIFRLIK